jgi:DNA-binding CsgD family transcriptional regulator
VAALLRGALNVTAVASIRRSTYLGHEVQLSRSDLGGALDFLREAGELDGDEPFPPRLLARLASLIRCQCLTYCEIDRRRGEIVFRTSTDSVEPPPDDAYWATVHEHPIRRHRAGTGELGAFKIYDFTTPRALRRTRFYADFLRPLNSGGFVMSVSLPAPAGYTRTFTFEREGHDFDERERTLLDVLQPHLVQIRQATEVRRRARRSVAAVRADGLTERETEVLAHVAEGMRNFEIAQALWISPGTVRKHLDNIYAKLGATTRTAAVRLAQEQVSFADRGNSA